MVLQEAIYRVIATVGVSRFTTRDTPTIALKKLKLTDKRLRSTLRRVSAALALS
jgi:hypothetical protein